ncbi:MAG: FIST signal transduction protein [Myxococcota bacterium]
MTPIGGVPMLQVTVGASEDINSVDAAHAAIDIALAQLDGNAPRAAVVFLGVGVDRRPALTAIRARLPGVPLIGGTTLAELTRSMGALEGTVQVILFAGDSLEVSAGRFDLDVVGGYGDVDELQVAARDAIAAATSTGQDSPKLCVCFGFHPMGAAPLHAAMAQALGPNVPLFGGGVTSVVGGDLEGEVCYGEELSRNAAVFLLFGGPLQISHAVAHGFRPVGEVHQITGAQARGVLLEVDGRPAMELYRNYLGVPGGEGSMFIHNPIAVETRDGQVLRTAFGQGPSPGSLLMAGEIEEGASMQLCEFDREGLLTASRTAMSDALSGWRGPPPTVALVFECLTRWICLGTWAPRSLDRMSELLPTDTTMAGGYLAGEFAPFRVAGEGYLHNCSVVVLLMGNV